MNKEESYEKPVEVIYLLRKIFLKKTFILTFTTIFGVMGVIVAVFSPERYTVVTTFVPQVGAGTPRSSSLGGLASLAGISLSESGGSRGEISPFLYPQIVKSVPYKKELLAITLKDTTTLESYLLDNNSTSVWSVIRKYTIGLPGLLMSKDENGSSAGTETGIYAINEKDKTLFSLLDQMMVVTFAEDDGLIVLAVKTGDPVISALVAEHSTSILQKMVIDFKLKSAREVLNYAEEEYSKKRIEYEALQDEVARYKDENQGIATSRSRVQLERLERELGIMVSVVQQLASSVEQSKMKVSEDTPIFQVIEPVVIPNERTEPKRKIIVIIWAFVGFFLGTVWVLIKTPLANARRAIMQK